MMAHSSDLNLFRPYKMGKYNLEHRVVLAPCTRCRALNNTPQEALIEYYSQRATPGGLLITEGTSIDPTAAGFPNVPGIFTREHIAAWKRVVDAVHDKGGILFYQLWHVGCASHHAYQPGGGAPVSSTANAISEESHVLMPNLTTGPYSKPRQLSADEIAKYVKLFCVAALNAIEAGFDGVDIHAAHGYLIDQFLKDGVNDRNDAYGGSLPNRCKFLMQVVEGVASTIGPHRVAVRISPATFHVESTDSDPLALGIGIVERLNTYQARVDCKLAYLHVTEPYLADPNREMRPPKFFTREKQGMLMRSLRRLYCGTFMSSGCYTRALANHIIKSGQADLVGFGRLFIANPDLILRFKLDAPLNQIKLGTLYTSDPVIGYTDYPFFSGQSSGDGSSSKKPKLEL